MRVEIPLAYLAVTALMLFTLLMIRIAFKLPTVKQNQTVKSSTPFENKNLMVLLGSGGHTGEMFRLLSTVDDLNKLHHIDWVISSKDTTSVVQLRKFTDSINFEAFNILTLSRARKVGEGKLSSIFSIVTSLIDTVFKITILTNKPDILMLNGPGTAVPLVLILFFFNLIGLTNTKILYVESLARVNDLSLSGKFCYLFVDRFLVQWPTLQRKYPKTEYYGILV